MSYPTFLDATIARASKLDAKHNQMIRIIRLLIENEGIREQRTSLPGKLFVPADCKRCGSSFGWRRQPPQTYYDHFPAHAPPTREQVAE